MEPFVVHTGRAATLRRENIDTDQICPARFCMRITKTGYADALFAHWRNEPEFFMNDPRRDGASVLIAGANFGIGSSREHAVWALRDYGFRAVISVKFGDIFLGNALKNALLPVVLDGQAVAALAAEADADPRMVVTVDLDSLEVRTGIGTWPYRIEPKARQMLLDGADEIDLTLRRAADVAAYEARRPEWLPAIGSRA